MRSVFGLIGTSRVRTRQCAGKVSPRTDKPEPARLANDGSSRKELV